MSIDFELNDGVALVTINRPERMNALDAAHYQALSQVWTRVRDDDAIRVAIVTGAGEKSFCAGADIKSWVGREKPLRELWLTQQDQLLNRGLEVWKPVIAAVNGHCLGGGMTLLMATDVRIAVPAARFSLAEVKRGIIAGNGGTQRILRQLPYCIGMEMLLTGDAIDAETALRFGLVNRVVPAEKLLDAAYEFAGRIAANAPLAVQAAKELAIRALDLPLAAGLRLEQVVGHVLHASADTKEGQRAFAERRKPAFKGE
ncbi:MAG: enoyl-CoA hydratase/isomerase family protein [Alphaproteobacteria bacterium]|nr:enoyl-CoA hydratase/isomerase family protein [Alphaproteobacteria bacterium]